MTPYASQLRHCLAVDSRSSSEIARIAGVSQPTVSRFRLSDGVRLRRSDPFIKLCNLYGIAVAIAPRKAHGYNNLLCEAILDAWDGSERHGRALLAVIKDLKSLRQSTRSSEGD